MWGVKRPILCCLGIGQKKQWQVWTFVFLKPRNCFTAEIAVFTFASHSLVLQFSRIHVSFVAPMKRSHARYICLFFRR